MPWMRGGTVSVTHGLTTVVGNNCDFAANARIGDSFVGPDGLNYEIGNVASPTVISIIPAYRGATVSGAAYSIMPVQGYAKALADAFNNINTQFATKLTSLGTTGNYDVLPVSKGGTGRSYIEGLNLIWNSAMSISISPGAAYIPGIGSSLEVTVPLTLTIASGSLNPDTFYYLYSNGGAPALELSLTMADGYTGTTARQKSGDPTRRFLFALRSGSGGGFLPVIQNGDMLEYQGITNLAPFRVIAGGTSTTPYVVYLIAVVPPVASSVLVNCHNATPGVGGPMFWIANYQFQNLTLRGVDSSTRQALRLPLKNVCFVFYFNSPGGSANFDVLGYSTER